MDVITEIRNTELSINAGVKLCAFCHARIPPCGGICDDTNTGFHAWHNECYDAHRAALGIAARFPRVVRFKHEPSASELETARNGNVYGDDSIWDFDGMTESEFLGDVGDK